MDTSLLKDWAEKELRDHDDDTDGSIALCVECHVWREALALIAENERLRSALQSIEGAIRVSRPSLLNQSFSNIVRGALGERV